MTTSCISQIRNGMSEMDAEDFVGQPALAGTDNEEADLATMAELYDMVDQARRKVVALAKPARRLAISMEDAMIAQADGDLGLTDEEFADLVAGISQY